MQICDRFFTGMENLNRHVASVHKVFTQKTILNSHIASVHEGIKPVNCRVCDHIIQNREERNINWLSILNQYMKERIQTRKL